VIVEIADFRVKPDDVAPFGEAIQRAAQLTLAKAEGYLGHTVVRSHETPGRFVLTVHWSTLEAHTVGFRGSSAFVEWRTIIGPFFLQPPHVEHFDTVPPA
jgi:heme-degrading monooxygenase HmoA